MLCRYDAINFKNNGCIVQALALVVLVNIEIQLPPRNKSPSPVQVLNVLCSVVAPREAPYTYLPSQPIVPELPDRRDSGGEVVFYRHVLTLRHTRKSLKKQYRFS